MNRLSSLNQKNCFADPELKKNYNKELFSVVSDKYNTATRMLSLFQDQYWKSELINYLPKKDNINCLDLACGTGDITFMLAKKYPNSTIYGLDLTPSMTNIAKKINSYSNVNFVNEDMCNMPFKSETFDIVTAGYALRNAPNLNSCLQEISRVLKSDGILAVLDFCKPNNIIHQKIQYTVMKYWGYFCGLVLHGNPEVYGYISKSINHYPTNFQLQKLINESNYELITNKKFFFGFTEIIILKKKY